MKRTMLKRRTPMHANHAGSRKHPSPTKYKSRERDTEYMLFVKTMPCMVYQLDAIQCMSVAKQDGGPSLVTKCSGDVEADHKSSGALSHKSKDNTVIPLCQLHHRERTDHTGSFKHYKQADMRAFVVAAIQMTQNLARRYGMEVPA